MSSALTESATSSRFTVVPASYVVFRRRHEGHDQVLLQLRTGTGYMDGYWANGAAGHIEEGESVFEAAHREAMEELGVTGLQLRPLCTMHRRAGDEPIDQRVDHFLLATDWTGVPSIMEPDKCGGLQWFDLDALPEQVVPHERRVVESLVGEALAPIVTHGF